MYRSFIYLIFLISVFGTLSSCGSKKDLVYFQADSTQLMSQYQNYIPKIQTEDILTITISAADAKAAMAFNLQNPYQINGANSQDIAMKPTYTVGSDGHIDFPVLGKIKLAGLTRLQAIEKLKEDLKKYIVNPNVTMSFNNFKVTVLGEVARPNTFTLSNERVTILDALGMAGDMTIKGVRNNVLVIREIEGRKTMHRLDLTKQDVLNSPYYYLAQNDVVYVEPNKSQARNANLGQNTNVWISISSLIITIVAVIVSNRK